MAMTWAVHTADPVTVWGRSLTAGTIGGAHCGVLVWSVLCPPVPNAGLWALGLLMALPVGALVGVVAGFVTGTVLAGFQAARPAGLDRTAARGVAAAAAGLPVLVIIGVTERSDPTGLAVVGLPLAVATAFAAASIAPLLVAPVWSVVETGPVVLPPSVGVGRP